MSNDININMVNPEEPSSSSVKKPITVKAGSRSGDYVLGSDNTWHSIYSNGYVSKDKHAFPPVLFENKESDTEKSFLRYINLMSKITIIFVLIISVLFAYNFIKREIKYINPSSSSSIFDS